MGLFLLEWIVVTDKSEVREKAWWGLLYCHFPDNWKEGGWIGNIQDSFSIASRLYSSSASYGRITTLCFASYERWPIVDIRSRLQDLLTRSLIPFKLFQSSWRKNFRYPGRWWFICTNQVSVAAITGMAQLTVVPLGHGRMERSKGDLSESFKLYRISLRFWSGS